MTVVGHGREEVVRSVLGELGPGQLGPGQLGPGLLGPGQLGPGAQLSGAQLSAPKKWLSALKKVDSWAPDSLAHI